jgi:cytochrome c
VSQSTLARSLRAAFVVASIAPAAASHADGTTEPQHGDPSRGAAVYQICAACHSLDEDDVGPHHRGVVGRAAAAVSGYAYSPALKASGLVWSPSNLDRWLTNPQALVPGSKMFFVLPSEQDRADVIAYLSEQR